MSIANYLAQLNNLRNQLADNLVEKGVDATQDESLTSLIPKVLDIEQHSGTGAVVSFKSCRSDRSLADKIHVTSGMTEVYLQSDTLLNPDLTINDFTVSENVTGLTYVNENLLHITFSALSFGDTVSVQARPSAYLYKNGGSDTWKSTVRDRLEDYYYNVFGMTYAKKGDRSDSGTWAITSPKSFPCKRNSVQLATVYNENMPSSDSWVVCADSYVAPNGSYQCDFNQRDASVCNILWSVCPTKDCGDVLKIRWEGMAYYRDTNITQIWELYVFENGDAMILYEKRDDRYLSGRNSLFGRNYTMPAAMGAVSFYAKDCILSDYDVVDDFYSIKKHHSFTWKFKTEHTLAEILGNATDSVDFVSSTSKQDDSSFTLQIPQMKWSLSGANLNYIVISGNTWIGVGASAENVTVNRRDASLYEARVGLFILTDLGNLECTKITWKGASAYSGAIDQEWELYLFSNGDAMIHLTKLGTSKNGSYSFFGNTYTIADGGDCSFYRTNANGTAWEIVQAQYDITKHHDV